MEGNKQKANPWKTLYKFAFRLTLGILILLILACWLLPPIYRARRLALYARSRSEMSVLISAIVIYQGTYGRYPVSSNLANSVCSDFTFGTFGTSAAAIGITNARGYQANNSEVMAILMDLTKFPNGKDTVNADHSRNPQKLLFLNTMVNSNTNSPGLGLDGVYRDPWGNPYIITLDLNNDRKCRDAFYRLASVSEIDPSNASGLHGLFRSTPPLYHSPETRDTFEAQTPVMVWSLGPDGKADPAQKADAGVNKDNVLSW